MSLYVYVHIYIIYMCVYRRHQSSVLNVCLYNKLVIVKSQYLTPDLTSMHFSDDMFKGIYEWNFINFIENS